MSDIGKRRSPKGGERPMAEWEAESHEARQPTIDVCRAAIREHTRQLIGLAGAVWLFFVGGSGFAGMLNLMDERYRLGLAAIPGTSHEAFEGYRILGWVYGVYAIALMVLAVRAFGAARKRQYGWLRAPLWASLAGSAILVVWWFGDFAWAFSSSISNIWLAALLLAAAAYDRFWEVPDAQVLSVALQQGELERPCEGVSTLRDPYGVAVRDQTRQLAGLVGAAWLFVWGSGAAPSLLFLLNPDVHAMFTRQQAAGISGPGWLTYFISSCCLAGYGVVLIILSICAFSKALKREYRWLRIPCVAGAAGALILFVFSVIVLRGTQGTGSLLAASGLLGAAAYDRFWKGKAFIQASSPEEAP